MYVHAHTTQCQTTIKLQQNAKKKKHKYQEREKLKTPYSKIFKIKISIWRIKIRLSNYNKV